LSARLIVHEGLSEHLLVRMLATLMMVAMTRLMFVIFLGLRSAFLAVNATISVSGGRRAGASLMGTYLVWSGRGICHKFSLSSVNKHDYTRFPAMILLCLRVVKVIATLRSPFRHSEFVGSVASVRYFCIRLPGFGRSRLVL
jgi:hypothetical protein